MEKLKQTEFLMLAIMWVVLVLTFGLALLLDYPFFWEHYVGIGALLTTTLFVWKKPHRALRAVGLLLLLSSLGLCQLIFFLDFYLYGNNLVFLLYPTVMGIILLIKRRDRVEAKLKWLVSRKDEELLVDKAERKRQEVWVNELKKRFAPLSTEQLKAKQQEERLIPQAQEAIRQLLEERGE